MPALQIKFSLSLSLSLSLSVSRMRVLTGVSGKTFRCPFVGAYHFVYSNHSGGDCRNPVSYVRPCAATSRLRFHFRHCPDSAYTRDHGQLLLRQFHEFFLPDPPKRLRFHRRVSLFVTKQDYT